MPSAPYRYRADQSSLLLPWYRRVVWDPIVPHIPVRVTPNMLTAAGTISAAAACALVLTAAADWRWRFALAGVLVLIYITLDNLDGLHARRTGQSSRVGEQLDHGLDTFNSGFIAIAVCRALVLPEWLTLAMVASANIPFFATHWEHLRGGTIRMGRVADIEGGTAAALVLVALAAAGTREWPAASFVAAGAVAAQGVWTGAQALARVRAGRQDWLPLAAGMGGITAWFMSGAAPFWPLAILMALLNPLCAGRAIAARAGAASRFRLDMAAAAAMAAIGTVALVQPGAAVAGPSAAWTVAAALAAGAAGELVAGLRRSTA